MARATRDIEYRFFRVAIDGDGVAVVTLDEPGESVNTLSDELQEEMRRLWPTLQDDPKVKAIVLTSGKKDNFIAGAKIEMLQRCQSAREATDLSRGGQQMLDQIAASPKPVIAAIDGAALGGGLELALACHYRVATENRKTALGLPEVMLGLIPGAGGTQRLPRLIGAQQALGLILTGKQLKAKKAWKLGIVDEVVPQPLLLQVAKERAAAFGGGRRLPLRGHEALIAQLKKGKADQQALMALALEENPVGRRILFRQAEKQALKKSRGNYPAIPAAIEAVRTGLESGMEKGLQKEAELFGQLVTTDVSKQLVRVFFAQNALKKDSGVDDPSVQPKAVKQVAVLGGGLMGGGIAYVTSAVAGKPVRLKERDDEGLGRGYAYVRGILDERVKRRSITRLDREEVMARLTGTSGYEGLQGADVVIEAVFEDLALKHRVIRDIEAVTRDDAIFASNTSTLPITKLAEASKWPETVVGMHYFSPVHKMPLLEVINGEKTAPWVTATAVALGKAQGKTVIVVNDGPGFYTSRILGPYVNEAAWLLSEGADIHQVDEAMVDWGFPVGPIMLLDEVGIDVAQKASKTMLEAFGERMRPPEALQKVIDDGRLGRKNGKGFYTYGEKKKHVDPTVYRLLPGGEKRKRFDKREIQDRLGLQFCNEAALCLEQRILRSARDGDIGAIFGLGFPPFRGGPFRYMDAEGVGEIVRRMRELEQKLGQRFKPAQLLVDMAAKGESFYAD
ncbi:fatty acid oxidation complex subunit alpha FadJ [Vulgatibacter sp.]|uniref:fatty acid oxidation complex subunit alpha FadJ n=1 Tax=Vulgatibacter sp. TaxID=1971226 RepID=UPI00356717DA